MNPDRKQKNDPFRRATPEQQQALELVGLTVKAMNECAAGERRKGGRETAGVMQALAGTLEKARQTGGPQQRFIAIAEAIACTEGTAQRADASGDKKLGGYLNKFAMQLRANVAESVKVINEKPRKRRQLPLPRHSKRKP
jgi:hypothetical protein